MTLTPVKMNIPAEANIIIGQTHFIKSVEDLYEVLITSSPGIKFGIAFCEASQERLVRWDGNDRELIDAAVANAQAIGAGHVFVILTGGVHCFLRHCQPGRGYRGRARAGKGSGRGGGRPGTCRRGNRGAPEGEKRLPAQDWLQKVTRIINKLP
jgi:hypothetical protein